jgi:hypothetical protein
MKWEDKNVLLLKKLTYGTATVVFYFFLPCRRACFFGWVIKVDVIAGDGVGFVRDCQIEIFMIFRGDAELT